MLPTCPALHRSARAVAPMAILLAGVLGTGCMRPSSAVAPMSGKRVESDRGMVAASHPDAAAAGATILAQGGLITVRDMNTYPVTAMRPLCTMWRGYTLLGAPPPMGGAAVLEMLQMADAAGVADAGSFTENGAAVAKLADIMRIGNADAGAYRGDPAALRVPAHGVVHPDFARSRAGLVGGALPDTVVAGNPWAFDTLAAAGTCGKYNPYPASAVLRTGSANSAPRDTTTAEEGQSFTSHLAVVDGDGSAVSATTTVGVLFGSGVYTDGFFLNSGGSNFDAKTRGTNRYSNSTMAPTLILDGDKVRLVVGAAGSQYIQPAITQVTIRMLAFGEDPAVALSAPRIHASSTMKEVEVEPGFSTSVYQALVARGYSPASRVRDISFGGVHAVFVRKDGKRIGVADPRRDGTAAGW